MTYLYVIAPVSVERPIKIGVADNPDTRLAELQTGNPYKLAVCHRLHIANSGGPARSVAFALEHAVHLRLEPYAMHGEWFDYPATSGAVAIETVRLTMLDPVWGRASRRYKLARLQSAADWGPQIKKINQALYRHTGRTCANHVLAKLLTDHGYDRLCHGFREALRVIPLIKRNGKVERAAVAFLVQHAAGIARK